jgi:hypothetical protein
VKSSRGVLGSVLLITLCLPGCDDPPECKLQVGISGATEGAASWSLVGEDKCSFVDVADLGASGYAIAFTKGTDQFILVIDTPVPDVGLFAGEAIFVSQGYLWQAPSATCTVMITKMDSEDWTLRDFISVEGTFQCNQPLTSTDPEVGDLMLTTLTFEGHLYNEFASAS